MKPLRIAAASLMAGSALPALYRIPTSHTAPYVTEAVATGLLLALGAFAFTRKSLFAQTVGRGMAWAQVVSLAYGYFTISGPMNRSALPTALMAATALALSYPLVNTPEARATFAPARFRRLFLAGATATVVVAAAAFYFAAFGVASQLTPMIAFNATLGAVLLLATNGLLRMRGWGLLLGGLASVVCLASMPFGTLISSSMTPLALFLAAMPMFLCWILPLVLARRSAQRVRIGQAATRVRVGADAAAEEEELSVEDAAGGRHLQRALE